MGRLPGRSSAASGVSPRRVNDLKEAHPPPRCSSGSPSPLSFKVLAAGVDRHQVLEQPVVHGQRDQRAHGGVAAGDVAALKQVIQDPPSLAGGHRSEAERRVSLSGDSYPVVRSTYAMLRRAAIGIW